MRIWMKSFLAWVKFKEVVMELKLLSRKAVLDLYILSSNFFLIKSFLQEIFIQIQLKFCFMHVLNAEVVNDLDRSNNLHSKFKLMHCSI